MSTLVASLISLIRPSGHRTERWGPDAFFVCVLEPRWLSEPLGFLLLSCVLAAEAVIVVVAIGLAFGSGRFVVNGISCVSFDKPSFSIGLDVLWPVGVGNWPHCFKRHGTRFVEIPWL